MPFAPLRAIILASGNGTILNWNTDAESLTDTQNPLAVGQSLFQSIPEMQPILLNGSDIFVPANKIEAQMDLSRAFGNCCTARCEVKRVTDDTFLIEIAQSGGSFDAQLNHETLMERRLNSIHEIAKAGSWDLNLKTQEIWFSEGFWRLFGVDAHRPNLTTDDFLNVVHLDYQEKCRKRIADIAAGVEPSGDLEYQIVRDDGSTAWILCRYRVNHDETGKPIFVEGTCQDVTERKLTELSLMAEQLRMNKTVESAPVVICTLGIHSDLRPYFPFVAPQIADLFGFTPKDLCEDATCALKLIHPEDQARIVETFSQVLKSPAPIHQTFRVEHPTRGRLWIEGQAIPARQLDGQTLWHGYLSDITERVQNAEALRQTEEKLRSNEERFRRFADAIPLLILGMDSQGKISFSNRKGVEFFGGNAGDLSRAGWSNFIHSDDLALAQLDHVESTKSELAFASRLRLRRYDGKYIWHIFRQMPWHDEEGKVVQWYAICTDVEELIQSEKLIRQSEVLHRRLVELLPDAIFICRNGLIEFCNPACKALFGATTSDGLIGKSYLEFFHKDVHQRVAKQFESIMITGRPSPSSRESIIRLDGQQAAVNVVGIPILDRGEPAILVSMHDLNDRERVQEVLQSILGSVHDAILTIDDQGTIQLANLATEKLFGYTISELIGKNVKVLMPSPYRDGHDGYLANYLRTKQPKVIGIGREVEGLRKDGTLFPIELAVNSFHLNGKQHFTGVVRDITKRKLLEDQFRQSQKMEAIGRLAGGVAHDFNNLLCVINGYSELILDDIGQKDPLFDLITAIRGAGERASRLTEQLLTFSRKSIIEPKILCLDELVAQSTKLLQRLIGEDVLLTVTTASRPLSIKADPSQIEQVILNLAVNARDAMPKGGNLVIETHSLVIDANSPSKYADVAYGKYVQLSVIDTGCGMTDEIKSKIFEPFFTTKGVGEGTGLGLAAVHGVVKQCNGGIHVDSEVGKGTRFDIVFPVAEERPPSPEHDASQKVPRGTETVLLVEDEDAVRTLAALSLELQGYKVLKATSGAEAIQIAQEYAGMIDLLLTDVVMPNMSGREAAIAIRKIRPHLSVLYMTGYTDDAVIRHGIQSSGSHFLQKPFSPKTIAVKVREALDTRNSRPIS